MSTRSWKRGGVYPTIGLRPSGDMTVQGGSSHALNSSRCPKITNFAQHVEVKTVRFDGPTTLTTMSKTAALELRDKVSSNGYAKKNGIKNIYVNGVDINELK